MKNPWVIIVLIAVVLIGGSVWYSSNSALTNNEGVVIEPKIKGGDDTLVTLTEYSDFQCPACAAFYPVVNEVLELYGDAIRFEYKHFPLPFHPLAEPAARAAEAAGQQDAFFAFHDELFLNQQTWANSVNSTGLFVQYATDLGLDVDMFRRHYNSSIIRDHVRAETREARELGITGTPTFFLNGERMSIETYDDFRNQIATAINPDIKFDLTE